jgi:predicted PurR-regulated permease PerM
MADRATPLSKRTIDLAIRLVVLGIVIAWCLQIVGPFVEIALWAVILAVALHPAFLWLARILGDRPRLAAAVFTLLMLAVVFGPISLLATTMVRNMTEVATRFADGSLQIPPPPAGLLELPLVGVRLHAAWLEASTNLLEVARLAAPHLEPVGRVLLNLAAGATVAFLQVVVATVVAGILLVTAEPLGAYARGFAKRLVPERGDAFVSLISATTRGVARGIVGVAILQSLLIGLGFIAADIPFAGILTFLVLVLSIVQIGPTVVVVGAIIYAWWSLDTVTALLFTAWMVPANLFDNVLRPMLIAQGLTVPLLVILVGVIGGALAYGLIGLFIGPVVLGIGYELLLAWIADDPGVPDERGRGHHAPQLPRGDQP